VVDVGPFRAERAAATALSDRRGETSWPAAVRIDGDRFQNDIVQSGSGQIGRAQIDVEQPGAPEIRSLQIGAGPIDLLEQTAPQIGAFELHSTRLDLGESGIAEIRTPQIGPGQLDLTQIGIPQIGAPELSAARLASVGPQPPQIGALEPGPGQIGLLEGARPPGLSALGRGDPRPAQVGMAQAGGAEPGIAQVGPAQVGMSQIGQQEIRPQEPDLNGAGEAQAFGDRVGWSRRSIQRRSSARPPTATSQPSPTPICT